MAIRTYTGVDLINYLHDYISGPSGFLTPPVVTPTSPGVLSISANDNGSFTAPPDLGVALSWAFKYGITADLDFDAVPAIPDGAQITNVTLKHNASVNTFGDADITGNGTVGDVQSLALAFVGGTITLRSVGEPCPDITLEVTQSDFDSSPVSAPVHATATGNGTITTSTHQVFDYSGSPIDKATLVATFGSLLWEIFLSNADAGESNVAQDIVNENSHAGTVELFCNLEINNFELVVEYTEEDPPVVLNPASGEIEPGQQITGTGEGAADLEYAALIGDLVIPIIPKIISPDEVLLEVPHPPTDDCVASIAACPECEDCFTPCENDLTSEECQACMEACFQCLENELENTELAEQCQQSSGVPPEIPIIIICGDPGTQFSGSVPLGSFTIIVANGSGLYRLTNGKANDTLYTAARDGTTYDVKIPFPGGKTGFFRS
jgi:hypothetical protein